MLIHQLTTGECFDLLARVTMGRLACARDNQPYVVPISLYFDGTAALYSFSTVGQKIMWMRDNPKVCVEADDVIDRFHWTSVVVTGRYEELARSAVGHDEVRRALNMLETRSEWWFPGAAKLLTDTAQASSVLFRVRIETVSGRRAARSTGERT